MNRPNRISPRRAAPLALAALLVLPVAAAGDTPASWTRWGGREQSFAAPGTEVADSSGERGFAKANAVLADGRVTMHAGTPVEAPAAEPAEESEAIRILRAVDAATRAVGGVRYRATSVPGGIATNFVSAAEGGGLMFGWTGQRPERFAVRIQTTRPGTGEPLEVTGGSDGENYFLLDHLAKRAYQDFDPAVMGSGGNALFGISMPEFVHPTPFSDEINADVAELQGSEVVAGVECHKIHVVYAGGQGQSTWFFSKEDNLPRRRIRHFSTPQGDGTLDITITELEADPEVGPDAFAMKLPEGYEKVDDFAP